MGRAAELSPRHKLDENARKDLRGGFSTLYFPQKCSRDVFVLMTIFADQTRHALYLPCYGALEIICVISTARGSDGSIVFNIFAQFFLVSRFFLSPR